MKVVALGVHILDVLARPVAEIPDGQGSQLVEQIKITAAGAAGGTAVTLAKLGAQVHSVGAIGADNAGRMLTMMLEDYGISCEHLVRKPELQTSATVLPIRPNGDRPAFHVIGATAGFTVDDVPLDLIAGATHLHFGAPEFLGGEVAAKILAHARANGVTTSADILAEGNPGLLEWIAPALPHLDYLLPNDEQVLGFTGADTLLDGCRALLERGVGCVAATAGADGAVVVEAGTHITVPAYPVDVVDTTGCGDAFSAGFVRGVGLGMTAAEAAEFGCAAAAQVATGLGSDHGDFDLESLRKFVATEAAGAR
ncbi:carbohydrate kinase family protein [Rhodococcus spelaei]|uniref:Carbohydrate kinase family protein n=1 Tax=Rhodococcus spelaei TaxID=2546320 RepID=A0A541BRC6_9NOCA|nr:PfkB family carbohydrate kinase [Rhodococcus spelaei]TQF74881.1 carbohydrate kinase family protein [Rhodococcus spelaei]